LDDSYKSQLDGEIPIRQKEMTFKVIEQREQEASLNQSDF